MRGILSSIVAAGVAGGCVSTIPPRPPPRPLDSLKAYARAYLEVTGDLDKVKVSYLPFTVEGEPSYAVFTPTEALRLAPNEEMRVKLEREIELLGRNRPAFDPTDPFLTRIRYPPTLVYRNGPAPACHPKDLLCYAAVTEQASLPDTTLAGLVFYPWFNTNVLESRYSLPTELSRLLSSEFAQLIGSLPRRARAFVEGVPLRFVDSRSALGERTLWVRAVPGVTDRDTRIEVSPILVRAVFVRTARRSDRYLREISNAEERGNSIVFASTYRDSRDIEAVLRALQNGFTEPFRFALAHELAHVYIGQGVPGGSERAADCFGVANLLRAGFPVDPGVLRQAVLKAFNEGSTEMLWDGVASETEIAKRMSAIEALATMPVETVEQECQKV